MGVLFQAVRAPSIPATGYMLLMNFKATLGLLATIGTLLQASVVDAQSLIRDAEIEQTLRLVLQPLQQSAGVGGTRVDIFVINDRSLNAFVAAGNNIFLNTGLIQRMKTVEMLQAVMGHELAHITQGHRAARVANLASARTAAGLGLAIGVAAAAAGGGAGLAVGLQDAVRKSVFAFSRSQESAADRASIRYLQGAGISPQAAVDVLNIFRGQEVLTISRQDPYVLTHPLTSDRITRMQTAAAAYKGGPSKQSAAIDYWYARLLIKFNGFIGNPGQNLRRIAKTDTGELATLARAIAYHRRPNPAKARSEIDRLIKMRPNDAFYHELRGQILLESGNSATAVTSYRKAAALAPKEPLILGGLGHALLAKGSGATVKEALDVLSRAYSRDPRDASTLRDLALAYARSNNPGQASILTAERYALESNFKQAAIHAKRAQGLLPRGSSGWRKADDIIAIARQLESKKK
jgi:predicted Zn-dependent protease